MVEELTLLIAETESWRNQHRMNRNHIDAAACAIRLAALKAALEIVKKHTSNT